MADRTTKMKKINEQKLQAFTIGSMGKRGLSKKEQDELRKKEEDEAAAHAFQEFVETFQETPNKTSKVWVKAGTYDAGARKEDTKDKGKLYKPSSRISEMHEKTSAEKAQEYARLLSSNDRKPDRLGKKRGDKDKKKSNLELFKEELKMIQEEREERHKYKGVVKTQMTTNFEVEKEIIMLRDASGELGSFDNGDPTTTNLYLGNLNPKISEQQLMEVFGKHGPLASIKIMWPRSEEEKARGRNCGFVAFMNRQDGERALKSLNGRDVMNYEMKLGWGKSVPIPPHPIYIPDSLVQLTLPPPSSGLPFNAQLAPKHMRLIGNTRFDESYMTHPETKDKVDQILYKAVVKVVMPTDRNLLMLIHRMVEFVIREGPMFEAMIMNREINNPMFRFLFENQSPAHCYYRWKLFSLLQGEPQREWNQTEFRMFEGGSIWKPPPINLYTQGMPEELIIEEEINEPNKGSLSATQRERLQDLLRFLSPERTKIAKAMVFCLEHADAADEISDCIEEALASPTTPIPRKLARLFLVSDILGNCAAKITNASYFRRAFETRLMKIFSHINETYKNMESRLKAESFKSRVMLILRAWEDWAIFSSDFLHRCHNTFHGVVPSDENDITDDMDGDGAPMSAGEADEDLDGVPLDGAALLKGAMLRGLPQVISSPNIVKNNSRTEEYDEEDNIEGKQSAESTKLSQPVVTSGGFVPSRWETVDPDQVEAQAITTSKWDTLEPPPPKSPSPPRITIKQGSNDSEDSQSSISQADSSSRDLDEERRTKLREIEVKSVQYQDELESGSRSLKSGWTIQQQVEHYRRKLIRKSDREAIVKSQSPERAEKRSKKERKERLKKSASPLEQNMSRHQSRSPHSSKKSPTSRKRSPASSSHGKRRASASPDSQSPERKHYRSSVSPDRKCKHLYNNLSPVRSKYGRVATPSPPCNIKYDSPYSRQRSPSPVVSKSVRYASPSPPPRSKHKNTSPRNKHRKQISPSPPPRVSKHSHREREESSSRKHKHKYKY